MWGGLPRQLSHGSHDSYTEAKLTRVSNSLLFTDVQCLGDRGCNLVDDILRLLDHGWLLGHIVEYDFDDPSAFLYSVSFNQSSADISSAMRARLLELSVTVLYVCQVNEESSRKK